MRRSLEEYRAKRRFSDTPEPEGQVGPAGGLSFVVQKHDATRLHWDFRLEWGGVLLSWAVTKGPSADPSEKRLAVRTEDHPLDYGGFEGTIPEGNYGAGTVMLWDRGKWEPLHDVDEGLASGKLHFLLHGERMRGVWALVRMRGRASEKRENWLLVKERDGEAVEDADGLVREHVTSVATARGMAGIAQGVAVQGVAGRRRKMANPAFIEPQLATLSADVPEGAGWWHEVKLDGYRGQISIGRDGVRVFSRSGADWTEKFAPVAAAAQGLPCDAALIDGEVLAESGDFSALQKALKARGALVFYAFDLLSLDGKGLRALPLAKRRATLEKLFDGYPGRVLRLSPVLRDGPKLWRDVCAAGGEGIVSKLAEKPSRTGRGTDWVKVKCGRRAEFLVLGWQPSDSAGRPFASLHLGSVEGGRIVYRGKVGTGFDEADFADLVPRLAALAVDGPPDGVERVRGARWVRPDVVVEIRFAEYTAEGRVRHGVYLGFREDKPAMQVSAEGAPEGAVVAGVRISSPDRAVWPKEGITKLDLARYLEAVGPAMLEDLAQRPLAFVRHPDGVEGKGFFQKHKGEGWPDAIRTFRDGEGEDRIYLSDVEGIVAAAQMGVVEFHIGGMRRDRLDRPDRMVFDLDPDPQVGWADVTAAARDVRDLLGAIGLASDPMVTGGKGVHLVVPLQRRADQEQVTEFARAFAVMLAGREPARFVATMSKAKRKGRTFVDWLRNQRGATAICPFSPRAREGAPVAVPVTWDELARLRAAAPFGLAEARERARHRVARAAGVTLTARMIAALAAVQ